MRVPPINSFFSHPVHRDKTKKSIVLHRTFVNVLIWTFYRGFMGISQKEVYITSDYMRKGRIFYRDQRGASLFTQQLIPLTDHAVNHNA